VLQAAAQEGTWTVDFVEEQGQWKVDWIAGYTPRFLRWQNWEEHTLPRMKKRATEHFDIFFFPGSTAERYIERIARGKEEGYWGICNFLGADANVRIKLVLFEDKTTKHRETGHQGMGGAYDRTIVEVYNEKESLDPYHETVHILMGPRGSPPALFNEGLAVYLSQRLGAHALKDLDGGEATIENRVKELKAQGDWIDLAGLMTYTEIGSDRSRSSVAYPEAASFVKFLIDTYGRDKFLQAYGRLKNSGDREVQARNVAELAAIYGQSLSQLRNAWEAWLVVVAPPSAAVPVTKLVIHVTADGKMPDVLRLLPAPEETTEGDAFELYEKATGSLPKDLDWGPIMRWRQTAVRDLPLEEVATALRPCEASLVLLEQAGKRRQCDWPVIVKDVPPTLQACHNGALLLSLRARYHLGRGDYPSCVRTLGTGFALARHLKAGPNVVHSMFGAAVAGVVCRGIEQYVQQPGVPSLEAALRALPTPLFHERPADIGGQDPNMQETIQFMMRRANRHIIALQYIEALRSYATKAGRWPETLDLLQTGLPADPVTDQPLTYRRPTETQAILTGPVPEGGRARDGLQYELSIVKDP
jgi:hypothetical protein